MENNFTRTMYGLILISLNDEIGDAVKLIESMY